MENTVWWLPRKERSRGTYRGRNLIAPGHGGLGEGNLEEVSVKSAAWRSVSSENRGGRGRLTLGLKCTLEPSVPAISPHLSTLSPGIACLWLTFSTPLSEQAPFLLSGTNFSFSVSTFSAYFSLPHVSIQLTLPHSSGSSTQDTFSEKPFLMLRLVQVTYCVSS